MMDTDIFRIDASWAEKLTKTRFSFLTAPETTVQRQTAITITIIHIQFLRPQDGESQYIASYGPVTPGNNQGFVSGSRGCQHVSYWYSAIDNMVIGILLLIIWN